MPATESVPDSVPRPGRTRRTKSTNYVRGLVNGRQSGGTCSGTHRDPPAASLRATESRTMTSGPTPSLGTNPRQIVPDEGPGRDERTTDSGAKVLAPPLEGDDCGRPGGGSAAPAVVQPSNRQAAAAAAEEKSCPPSRQPKSRGWRNRPGSKKRSRFPPPPVCAAHPPMPPEDWEKDIQEMELVDWEKRSFGSQPYGPEDLISFSQRDVSLYSVATPVLPITAVFSPAGGHPGPVAWTCHRVPPEEGQFTDPEE